MTYKLPQPKLPPLPEAGHCDSKHDMMGRPYSYTAEDMKAYAIEALKLHGIPFYVRKESVKA